VLKAGDQARSLWDGGSQCLGGSAGSDPQQQLRDRPETTVQLQRPAQAFGSRQKGRGKAQPNWVGSPVVLLPEGNRKVLQLPPVTANKRPGP